MQPTWLCNKEKPMEYMVLKSTAGQAPLGNTAGHTGIALVYTFDPAVPGTIITKNFGAGGIS